MYIPEENVSGAWRGKLATLANQHVCMMLWSWDVASFYSYNGC